MEHVRVRMEVRISSFIFSTERPLPRSDGGALRRKSARPGIERVTGLTERVYRRWDPSRNFSEAIGPKLALLRRCDPALFGNASVLRSLPTKDLAKYMHRCFARGAPTDAHLRMHACSYRLGRRV